MAVWTRRLSLALLAGVVGLATVGCDAATMAYFFMPESREPAKIKALACEDPKKEAPRVAILTWTAMETRSEFIHADRQLSDMLATQLRQLADDSKEKLTVLPSRKVEEYKNSHPSWRGTDMAEVGRQLHVDYVIYLEINALSMYESGSANQLLRGRASVTVSLYDVKHPDDTPNPEPFSCVYPSEARGSIQVDLDMNPMQFRQAFLAYTAKRLSYYFARYPKRDTYFTE